MEPVALTHQLMFRAGTSGRGATTTERCSADFLIGGESLLRELVRAAGGHSDFMSCFVSGHPDWNRQALAKLRLEAEPDTERGGVLLYICPECGDLGCGAYSALVKRNEGGYVWEAFAYENGYEEPRLLEAIGPFLFGAKAYEAALDGVAAL